MKFLIGTLIWFLVILIFGLPLLILSVFKWLIILFYSGRRISGEEEGSTSSNQNDGDILASLPPQDCMFGNGSSWEKTVVNFGFFLKLRGKEKSVKISVKQLREHFSKLFLSDHIEGGRYDKFFSYLVVRGGYVFRAFKKNLILEDHISEVTLKDKIDLQGNLISISIEKYLADWMLIGYKKDKPCWEMKLISMEDGETKIQTQYLAFKIHHANADGYSVLHILDKLCDNTSPYLVNDFKEGALGQLKQLLEGPLHLGRLSGTPPDKNPFKVTPGPRHQWMVSFTSFPLEELKNIRRKHNVHMSSVILTIITGAMREFLETERKLEEKDIPKFVKIGTTVPWPRHPSRDKNIPNKDKMCNHWIGAFLQVPIKDPDPLSRLSQIDSDLSSYHKVGLDKFTKRILFPVMWTLPASMLDKSLSQKDPGAAAGLTSLIGGDNYKLLGYSVEEIHPFMAIHDNCPYFSLPCFTFSHSGKLEVTFGTHPTVFKDQQSLNNFSHKLCHKQFNLLVEKSNNAT